MNVFGFFIERSRNLLIVQHTAGFATWCDNFLFILHFRQAEVQQLFLIGGLEESKFHITEQGSWDVTHMLQPVLVAELHHNDLG